MKEIMRKTLITLGAILVAAAPLWAAAPESEVAKLGNELTPLGAIKAGNADGTIPAWTGGITTPPKGFKEGEHLINPFPGDKPQFVITSANAAQYKDKLTAGAMAMFERYPDTWKMMVYPTRRTASYPETYYRASIENAKTASTTDDGNGVLNASFGVPFPLPSKGVEYIWNHLLRYRGETVERIFVQIAPTASGAFVPVKIHEKVIWAYSTPGKSIEDINNKLAYFVQEVTSPARLAGTVLLVHETLNQVKELRRAWTYNPGQRRVRRAPNVAYDNPGTGADAQRTSDDLDMFNGAPDRYEWTFLGRKEMYVPYNSYKLHEEGVDYSKIIQPGHTNPDFLRYELHRVYVVEATLRSNTRHIYEKRRFYIDEDSWSILAAEMYDSRGELWRVAESYTVNYYMQPLVWSTGEAFYDLQNGRYLILALHNNEPEYDFNKDFSLAEFTPEALRRAGMR